MKKTFALLLAAVMLLSCLGLSAAAGYEQPFAPGTLSSDTYRIPAIYTLNDGSVIAAADMRYGHGSDSPQNIDTLTAISPDGYSGWDYTIANRFDDYADGVTDKASASFIDSAIAQSKATGRIFLITDMFPSGGGYPTTKTGTGYLTVDGKRYLGLTQGSNSAQFNNFPYYIGDFTDGFAPVLTRSDNTATTYTVDEQYRLYQNGEALMMAQNGSEEQVQQNVFYQGADLSVYLTTYLVMKYSDDNGKTWSAPEILSRQVKNDNEGFLGIGPGRGFVTEYQGKERIIFCVYDNVGGENVSTIYSDDNGVTWTRGSETSVRSALGKTSEAQIVSLPDGSLRMFARNAHDFVAYADSTDGGHSWSKFQADFDLSANGNCMVSFINYSKKIDGKDVIIGSFCSNPYQRANGVIKVGLVGQNNDIDWITTYHVNQGFFAYSCLTELSDGNIGYLYEDEPAKVSYMVLTIGEDGSVSEINGNNIDFSYTPTAKEKFLGFFKSIILTLQKLFGII